MMIDEIKAFQKGVGHAAWNLNLDAFADRVGSDPEHEYTRTKFREFTELNRYLSRFDAETLGKIINEPVFNAPQSPFPPTRADRDDWKPAETKEEETKRLLRTNG